ncbi:MAG: signal peptidase I [Actinomycetota bacterium]|nr:signal peptidase I [Actinomycetota bacterium]
MSGASAASGASTSSGASGQPQRADGSTPVSEPGSGVGRGCVDREIESPDAKESGTAGSFLRELPVLILTAFVLAVIIKAFLVQAFFIPSGSMEQTLHGCPGCKGDRVLVNKFIYRFRDIQRGEIVVFDGKDTFTPEVVGVEPPTNAVAKVLRLLSSAVGLAPPGEEDFIKRVIAVGGDTVQCCDTKGRVTVNDVPLDESSYVYEDDKASFGPVEVPAGRLWLMGDHRSNSQDSRAHIDQEHSGTVAADQVIGKAFVIVWPPPRVGTLGVPETFDQPALDAAAVGAPYVLGLAAAVPLTAAARRRRR